MQGIFYSLAFCHIYRFTNEEWEGNAISVASQDGTFIPALSHNAVTDTLSLFVESAPSSATYVPDFLPLEKPVKNVGSFTSLPKLQTLIMLFP